MTLYNEIDPFAVAWLRELIADRLIAPGAVDARDIRDIMPTELVGHRQVHLFAGIGVWSLALRRAGVPDDAEVWTASCPCQPFSAAGKRTGTADERHLWPAAFHLIRNCRPRVVMGEQVASPDGLAWLDTVLADLEAEGYTCRACDLCAAGVGAPHIRQRLYWLADADCGRLEELEERDGGTEGRRATVQSWHDAVRCGEPERVGDADISRLQGRAGMRECPDQRALGTRSVAHGPGPTNGLWRAADWLLCRDAKWRPVEPGTFPLADAGAFRNRVGTLRGAGNAIVVACAEAFIRANLDWIMTHTESTNA